MKDYNFYPMNKLPEISVDDSTFSRTVLVYDKTSNDHIFENLGYYDFESSEWVHFGDESMNLICWCYVPDPKEYINQKKLKTVIHRGYRP